uniref:Tify domain-containing protein n=1 Tax=Solanum lycopersicum TaxID=4081 RepID=A0A3Q7EAP1_SOLLC
MTFALTRVCPSRYDPIKIAPLCIFYNEKVTVFDVQSDKVDDILKFVESSKQQLVVKTLSEG